MYLSFDQWQKYGRDEISGHWPTAPNGNRIWTKTDPRSITASYNRPAAAIAADIMRRYYPAFCAEWDKRAALANEEQQKVERTRQHCAMFQQYAAAHMSYHGPRTVAELRESVATMYAPGVSGVSISSADTVTIDHIAAVDIETAVEILRLVAQSETNRRNGR
jgi:hypothetical protein